MNLLKKHFRFVRPLIPRGTTALLNLLAACCLTLPLHAGTVTSAADDGSAGTLRAVIAGAQPGDRITFDPGLEGQTITLTARELVISKDLTITGLGANKLAISGNWNSGVFQVNSGPTVAIQGLTIRDGHQPFGGGGIANNATMTVSDCTFSGNYNSYYGSAILSTTRLTVNNCTFTDNLAQIYGGAVANWGTLTVNNCTFSGNSSAVYGGAIANSGTLTVNNTTIIGNFGLYGIGGIYNSGTVNCKNSIIANSASNYGGSAGTLNVAGINFSDDNTCPGFIQVTPTQLHFGPLADNGGPTMTHALLAPSVAIDTASDCNDWSGNPLTTDQRGMNRPQGAACDVGAFEQLPASARPIPSNDSYTMYEDEILFLAAPGVLGNDTDSQGAPLSVIGASRPAHGNLSLNSDGSLSYTSDVLFYGSDAFTYFVTDGQGTAMASVSITVIHVNHPPLADEQTVAPFESHPINIRLSGSDVDGDPLSFAVVVAPSHGTLSGTPPDLTYTPEANYTGWDSFEFKANDGLVDSAPATVSVQVQPDILVANPQTIWTCGSTPTSITLTGSDPDMDQVSFAVLSSPSHGTLSGTPPNLIYRPEANYIGTDSFTFKATDGTFDSVPGTISVLVQACTLWSGPKITFTKPDHADGTNPSFQDQISPAVRLARGDNNGLYNAQTEPGSDGWSSPADTEWAYGTTANFANLTFNSFFAWNGNNPRGAIGKNAVLHLITENIYLDIKITSWSCCGAGGFAYERSTPPVTVTLNGPRHMSVFSGGTFTDPGATAVDINGNPLEVTVTGTVDTSTSGIYTLIYSATDSDGHTATTRRTVEVGCIVVDVYSGFTRSGGGTPYSGLAGSFFAGAVNFATQNNYAWHPFGLNTFGADIWGALSVESTGTYSFSLDSDDGSLLYIDGDLVINNGGDHGAHTVSGSVGLAAGRHCFEVQFYNSGGVSGVNLHLPDGVTYACPGFKCPSDITVNSDPSVCGANVDFTLPTLADPCLGLAVSCSPPPGSFFPVGSTPVTCTTTDQAGKIFAQCSFNVIVTDNEGPIVSCPADVTVITTSASGMIVNYPAATGHDNCSTPTITYSKPSGSMFPLGTTTVTVTATDAQGNSAQCTFKVNVVYSWSGVLQPINADGSSVFKAGSTVPVTFQLTGASAGINAAVARLSYAKLSNTTPGLVNEADASGNATAGNRFLYDTTSGQYKFNWSTKGMTGGKYQLTIDLGDGVTRAVIVYLK